MLDKLYFRCLLLLCLFAFVTSSDPRCSQPRVEGEGDKQELRYYYDAGACYPFFFKGEGGNSNSFESDQECMTACAPDADTLYPPGDQVCSLKVDPGPCYGLLLKYHYSMEDKTCRLFHYGGCQGNGNRFDSREQCLKLCGAKSGRSIGSGGDHNPDATTVNTGMIVGVVGGVIFAVAVISALGLFITQRYVCLLCRASCRCHASTRRFH
ncbi:hypothetical protein ACEWY4_016521 [Coilia grayii]|uniref:BPTI/Kunitz inhibitor domain-containing protein n=1 Tax=Coilia grayii TaxID=363190 RepID=A0ABD1JP33_9TELE